jgi:hypothetical protein
MLHHLAAQRASSLDQHHIQVEESSMPSTFTWLDYSESDRRKMLDVIALFREKDTRDELGVGSVRDAFADIFFPGTSTIQTRARYFLFVPWMYRLLEQRKVRSADVARVARQLEIELISGLMTGGEAGQGVIGERSRAALQRLPSNVYWLGLGIWGFRFFPGSHDQYHRSLDRFYAASHGRRSARTTEDDVLDDPVSPNWHPGLPPVPAGFPNNVTFTLTADEAEYLAERIKISVPSSLLNYLIDVGYDAPPVNFIWEHPSLANFPAGHRDRIIHARNFSVAIHGSALLYNLMLAELVKSEERIDEYRDRLLGWAYRLTDLRTELAQWDRQGFWEIAFASGSTITPQTRAFINAWLDFACAPGLAVTAADSSAMRALIHDRERRLKHQQARLDNPRAREQWNGAAGTGQLDYRWFRAQQLIADIQTALVPRNVYA